MLSCVYCCTARAQGYPGELVINVTYRLSKEKNELSFTVTATTDKATPGAVRDRMLSPHLHPFIPPHPPPRSQHRPALVLQPDWSWERYGARPRADPSQRRPLHPRGRQPDPDWAGACGWWGQVLGQAWRRGHVHAGGEGRWWGRWWGGGGMCLRAVRAGGGAGVGADAGARGGGGGGRRSGRCGGGVKGDPLPCTVSHGGGPDAPSLPSH